MRHAKTIVGGTAILLTGAVLGSTPWAGATAGPKAAGAGARHAVGSSVGTAGFDPAHFTQPVQNPYFPLVPGTVLRYRGSEGGEKLREKLVVTDKTRVILGVRATVVKDVLHHADGTLGEKTTDWYAPDNSGNVWYLGERTATYENGKLESREGSWLSGVNGATPGLIMPANPGPTDAYRQEFYRKHAEDQAWIVARRHHDVRVPYGRIHGALRSFEWTRLEPHVMALKIYGRGIGIVRERDIAGGNEKIELVSVTRP